MRHPLFGILIKISLLVLIIGLDACKARRIDSGLHAADPSDAYKAMQKRLMEIDTRGKLYLNGSPLIDELTMKHVKDRGGNPGSLVERPQACSKEIWEKDLTWQNQYLADLVGYIQDMQEPQIVRLEAMKIFAILTAQNFASCWEQKVQELLSDAFFSVAPPEEVLSSAVKKGDLQLKKWSCANVISCSNAIETALTLSKLMPDSDDLDVVLVNLLDSVQGVEMIGYSNLFMHRVQSVAQMKKFFALTGIEKPENRGRSIIISPNDGEFRELKKSLSVLINSFEEFYTEWSTGKDQNRVLYANIRSQYWFDVISQIYDEPVSYLQLEEDAPERQIVDSYVNSAVSQFVDLYHFNQAMYFFLDRLTMKDPKPWYDKLRRQVLVGKKIVEEEILLNGDPPENDRGEEISYEQMDRLLYSKYKLDYDSPDDGAIEPEIALLAISTFVSWEVYLPYRADLLDLLRFVAGMMEPESRLEHQKNFMDINLYFAAFEKQRNGYGKGALQLQGEDYEIPKAYKPELERVGKTFDRLAKIELDLAKKPGYRAFQSIHHEYEVMVALLNKRQTAMHALLEKLDEKPTYENWKGLGVVSDQEIAGLVKVLWAPGTGIDQFKFDLSDKTFDAMGQWIFIQCLERNNQDLLTLAQKREVQELGDYGYRLREKFFVDGKEIAYECPKVSGANAYTDLKSAVFSYVRKHSLAETKNELAKAIKDHPAMHGAMMLAMCMVVPPLGQMALQIPFLLGRLVPTAVRAYTVAKWIASATSFILRWRMTQLMFDSFVFGVGEFVFSSSLSKALGVKVAEEEEEMHRSALFNVKGIIMGAIIFGILPLAHGPVDAIVRRSFVGKGILGNDLWRRAMFSSARYESRLVNSKFIGKFLPGEKLLEFGLFQGGVIKEASKIAFKTTTERLRVMALTGFSWSAQYAAEVSIFTFSPMLQAEADELYLKIKGEYKEPDEFEKVWAKLYTPNKLTSFVSSMITAGAFTVNRASGAAVRASGYTGLKNTMRLWGQERARSVEMKDGKPTWERTNPYEELGAPRSVSQQDIIGIYEYRQESLMASLQQAHSIRASAQQALGRSGSNVEFNRSVLREVEAEIPAIKRQLERLAAAKMILLGEKGWRAAVGEHKDLFWPEIGDLASGSEVERRQQIHEELYGKRLEMLDPKTKDRLLRRLKDLGYRSNELKPWHGAFISSHMDHDGNRRQQAKKPWQILVEGGESMF